MINSERSSHFFLYRKSEVPLIKDNQVVDRKKCFNLSYRTESNLTDKSETNPGHRFLE